MRDGNDPQITLKEVLARDATDRVTRRAIRALQALRGDNLQSGADSGLRDVWDEICVQVQGEESVFWGAYLDILDRIIEPLVEGIPRTQLHSLWLETPGGEEWMWAVEEEWLDDAEAVGGGRADLPYCLEDVVEYLNERVLSTAEDWSNVRIRRYLDRC